MSGTASERDPTRRASDRELGIAQRRARALHQVLDSFDLQTVAQVEAGRWRTTFSTRTSGAGRLFGGMSLATAYLASHACVPSDHRLHWMSAVFLRPGRTEEAIELRAAPLRHGRSFSSMEAEVVQREKPILRATSTFRARATGGRNRGINHQFGTMPEVPTPDDCPDRETRRIQQYGPSWLEHPVNAVEVRVTDPRHLEAEVELPPRSLNWVRVPGAEGLDAALRTALLLYATDRALISAAALPHGILWTRSIAASLDHSIWLHTDPDPSRWHLFVAQCDVACDGLALIRLEAFDETGILVATCEQGGLVQIKSR